MKAIFTYHFFSFFMLISLVANSQLVPISGFVTHQNNGKVLEGVSLFETSSKIGTITDKRGYFRLMLKPGIINVSVTYDGFRDIVQNLVLLNDTTLNLQLEPKISLKGKQKSEEQVQISAIPGNQAEIKRQGR